MRAFEFHAGEVEDEDVTSLIVDLDSIVMLKEKIFWSESHPKVTRWLVMFSSGSHECVTKPAFDRILLAWKSK